MERDVPRSVALWVKEAMRPGPPDRGRVSTGSRTRCRVGRCAHPGAARPARTGRRRRRARAEDNNRRDLLTGQAGGIISARSKAQRLSRLTRSRSGSRRMRPNPSRWARPGERAPFGRFTFTHERASVFDVCGGVRHTCCCSRDRRRPHRLPGRAASAAAVTADRGCPAVPAVRDPVPPRPQAGSPASPVRCNGRKGSLKRAEVESGSPAANGRSRKNAVTSPPNGV
jgi:hypothetical protein